MKRSTAIAAVVMTLAIAGAIAWAGIDAERTELAEQARDDDAVQPGEVVGGETAVTAEGAPAGADPAEAPVEAAPLGATAPSVADDPERVRVAVEAARTMAPADITRDLAALEEQPRDEAWASEQESRLHAWADAQAATLSGRLADVRCHTSGCVAELVWPTYADSQREAHAFLAGDFGADCARELRTPMPQDPRVTYAALVVVTCSRQ